MRAAANSPRRNPWILGFAAFCNDAASESLLRLLPLYLAETLGAPLKAVGLMDGVAEATAALVKPAAGKLSDRSGRRKPWVSGGYLVSALSRLGLFAATGPLLATLLRFTDRLGKGIRGGPKDALLAASREREARGHGFAIDRALDFAGATLGLLAAAALLRGAAKLTAAKFRAAVALAILPGALAALLPVFAAEAEAGAGGKKSAPGEKGRWLGRDLAILFALGGLFALAASSDSFLLLAARARGFSLAQGLLLFAGYNLAVALLGPAGGKLADRFGRRRLIFAGWSVYALSYGGMALAGGKAGFAAALLAYGLYYALSEGALKALVGDLTPPAARGRAYGAFAMVQGLALLAGNLLFGAVADAAGGGDAGLRTALGLDALIAALAALGVFAWGRMRKPGTPAEAGRSSGALIPRRSPGRPPPRRRACARRPSPSASRIP